MHLWGEIYTALHGDCLSLAAMGIRALLEGIMIDRVGDQGSFKNNLKELERQGYLASHQRDILEATLEIGHASIHRGYVPTRDDLTLALDITETMFEMIYIHKEQAAELRRRIPPRK